MDKLLCRQGAIQKKLARRQLKGRVPGALGPYLRLPAAT
jgi:hypothetical protein